MESLVEVEQQQLQVALLQHITMDILEESNHLQLQLRVLINWKFGVLKVDVETQAAEAVMVDTL